MTEYIERTEELVLAMNAGARAIENTNRYHGAIYNKDVFSENPQEIPYLLAAKVLRDSSDAPIADVAPVRHAWWIERRSLHAMGEISAKCSACSKSVQYLGNPLNYCPNCGAKMDGRRVDGKENETEELG